MDGGQTLGGAPQQTLPQAAAQAGPIITGQGQSMPPDNGAPTGVPSLSLSPDQGTPMQPQQVAPQEQPQAPYQYQDTGTPSQGQGSSPAPAPTPVPPHPGSAQPYIEQPQAPLAEQPQTLVRDALAQRGIPVDSYTSDEELLSDLGSIASQQNSYPEQQVAPQPAAPQQPETGIPQQPSPSSEAWNPAWEQLLEIAPVTNLYKPREGFDSVATPILHTANQRLADRRDRAERLVDKPFEYLSENGLGDRLDNLKEEIRQEIRDEMWSQQRAASSRRETDDFFSQNKNVLFQLDEAGNERINPLTGQMLQTPIGESVSQALENFTQSHERHYGTGPDDWQKMNFVKTQLGFHQQMNQQASQQPADPNVQAAPAYNQNQNEQLKNNSVQQAIADSQQNNGAFYAPSQDGTIASAAQQADVPQNASLDFASSLRESAISKGLISPDSW